MPLSLPVPTIENTIDALVDAVVAAGAPSGFLTTTLANYGVTLDVTTVSPNDTGTTTTGHTKKKNVKFGSRGVPPPGLSILFYPHNDNYSYVYAPGGEKADIRIRVWSIWNDTVTQKLTANPDMVSRMFSTLNEAIRLVLSPTNLVGSGYTGGWSPLNDGTNYLFNPYVTTVIPNAWDTSGLNDMEQILHFSILEWGASRFGQAF